MKSITLLSFAVIGGAAVALPVAARAPGPCTDDIAQLSRTLGTQTGMGGVISEPTAGQSPLTLGDMTGGMPKPSDKAQPGGASLAGGGSPGTVGGVAGAAGAATGVETNDAIATGQIATSAADVRRQSEGLPTAAQQAAEGGKGGEQAGAADRVSRAKMALQRAIDLNARDDSACRDAVAQARSFAQSK